MVADTTYIAHRLFRFGEWDAALAVLGDADPALRAEIMYERYFFRLEGREEVEAAVEALDPGTAWGRFLRGKLAYSRQLLNFDPRPDDRETAENGFRGAAQDPELRGWALFFLGVFHDNILEDKKAAAELYMQALPGSDAFLESVIVRQMSASDAFLESVIVRHLTEHRPDKVALFRRSLMLRASVGARPQIAAAMLALAEVLDPADPERALLAESAQLIADELGLAWVQSGLKELKEP